MNFDEAVKELIELSKKNNNTVYSNDVLKYCDDEASDYEKFEKKLAEEEIDIVPSSDDNADEDQ